MNKKAGWLLVVLLGVALIAALPAEAGKKEGKPGKGFKPGKEARPKLEKVEKTGVIEVKAADKTKKEKYDNVLLKVGEEIFKLLPGGKHGIGKDGLKLLAGMAGKTVTVAGQLLPAGPKYPMAAIKVHSCPQLPQTEKGSGAKPAPATGAAIGAGSASAANSGAAPAADSAVAPASGSAVDGDDDEDNGSGS